MTFTSGIFFQKVASHFRNIQTEVQRGLVRKYNHTSVKKKKLSKNPSTDNSCAFCFPLCPLQQRDWGSRKNENEASSMAVWPKGKWRDTSEQRQALKSVGKSSRGTGLAQPQQISTALSSYKGVKGDLTVEKPDNEPSGNITSNEPSQRDQPPDTLLSGHFIFLILLPKMHNLTPIKRIHWTNVN